MFVLINRLLPREAWAEHRADDDTTSGDSGRRVGCWGVAPCLSNVCDGRQDRVLRSSELARDPVGMVGEEAVDETDLVDNDQTEHEADHS